MRTRLLKAISDFDTITIETVYKEMLSEFLEKLKSIGAPRDIMVDHGFGFTPKCTGITKPDQFSITLSSKYKTCEYFFRVDDFLDLQKWESRMEEVISLYKLIIESRISNNTETLRRINTITNS